MKIIKPKRKYTVTAFHLNCGRKQLPFLEKKHTITFQIKGSLIKKLTGKVFNGNKNHDLAVKNEFKTHVRFE